MPYITPTQDTIKRIDFNHVNSTTIRENTTHTHIKQIHGTKKKEKDIVVNRPSFIVGIPHLTEHTN